MARSLYSSIPRAPYAFEQAIFIRAFQPSRTLSSRAGQIRRDRYSRSRLRALASFSASAGVVGLSASAGGGSVFSEGWAGAGPAAGEVRGRVFFPSQLPSGGSP